MVSASEIRRKIGELLADQLSLQEFEDWFVSMRQDIHKSADLESRELAVSIDHLLSQFEDDSEPFRLALLEAVFAAQELPLVNCYGEPIFSSESNAEAVNQRAVA
jgi:hypothetical protein